MTTAYAPLHGVPVEHLEPGSPAWLQTMSASKIAAVVGLSPYESRYSLWCRMAGVLPDTSPKAQLLRGHYLEPGVAAWLQDQHPDWLLRRGGSWAHPDDARFTCSPDREGVLPGNETVGVELKTAADADEWGPAGSDEIPAGYKAQVQWQMFVRGTRRTHIGMLTCYLEFREYVVEYDPDDAEFLATEAEGFLASLPSKTSPGIRPSLDDHDATYEAVRAEHPLIEDRKVEIPGDIALRWLAAYETHDSATTELRGAKTALLDAMGTARVALLADAPIARRQPGKGSSVSLYAVKG